MEFRAIRESISNLNPNKILYIMAILAATEIVDGAINTKAIVRAESLRYKNIIPLVYKNAGPNICSGTMHELFIDSDGVVRERIKFASCDTR